LRDKTGQKCHNYINESAENRGKHSSSSTDTGEIKMFGENLKMIRDKKGITQEALADHVNVTRQTISKWERDVSVPSGDDLLALAAALDVDVVSFFGIQGYQMQDAAQMANLLAGINRQLVEQSRKNRALIWVIIVILAIFVLLILLTTLLNLLV